MANDLVDRQYVSRYAQPGFGLKVYQAGVLTDADAAPSVSLTREGETAPDWTRTAERAETGSYTITLSSAETAEPTLASLRWDYALGGVAQVYGHDIEVGPSAPAYDALPPAWQGVIESVWWKFADLFDSPYGGPHLQVYLQTHFGRNRLAHLMGDAMQVLNTAAGGHAFHPVGGDSFPFERWGGLLGDALYVEVLKHLVRSYVEQPEVILGVTVSRVDRRDYMNRWQQVLDFATNDLERDLSRYRQASMNLGHVSVLVAGGAYGNWGPQINPGGVGAAAARGYFWASRWH